MSEREQPRVHTTKDVTPPAGLTDAGKNLLAMLSAYDEAHADMTPEERDTMNKRVAAGEEDFMVSGVELTKRRAGVEIARTQSVTVGEGLRMADSLEDASQHIPGIRGLLHLLVQDGAPKDSYDR